MYAQNQIENEILASDHIIVVALVNDYISFMANKRISLINREYYKENALHLFLGNGYHEGKPSYKNIESKHVKCYISSEDTYDGYATFLKLVNTTALDL